jgi:hypothetical protein
VSATFTAFQHFVTPILQRSVLAILQRHSHDDVSSPRTLDGGVLLFVQLLNTH